MGQNIQIKNLAFIEKYLVSSVYFFIFLRRIFDIENIAQVTDLLTLDRILRPMLVAALLFFSSKTTRVLNTRILLGVLLSYSSIYFFEIIPTEPGLPAYIVYFCYFFYIVFFFLSLMSLGKSFTILPAYYRTKSSGNYSLLRHPIYASYFGFFGTFLICNLSFQNLFAYVALTIGLLLRCIEEEKVITQHDPNYLCTMKKKNRLIHPLIHSPLIVLIIYALYSKSFSRHPQFISIEMDTSVINLDPSQADDWSSFFIINHIYPRLYAESGLYRSRSIFGKKSFVCSLPSIPVTSEKCTRVKVLANFNHDLQGCNRMPYTVLDFKKELSIITTKKNWLLKNFAFCNSSRNSICFEFDKTSSIDSLLRSIYLRFGWSISKPSDKELGIAPYCFVANDSNDGNGVLKIDQMDVKISEKDLNADINLYSNSTNPSLQFKDFYNPISYFLVINGKYDFPEHLSDNIIKIFNRNKTIDSQSANKLNQLHIVLPDFIQECQTIAKDIEQETGVRSQCLNISSFTENIVKKNKDWIAFISPLTPGLPGKDGIDLQYFTQGSSDSWLGTDAPAKTKVRLVNQSSGTIQVNPKVICSIKPNPLGLSDMTFDDIFFCGYK